jgi:transcriptional regulator GlxA family with amidase domain
MANHGREFSGVREEALAGPGPSPRGFNPWDARTETILVANNPAMRTLAAGSKAMAVAGIRNALRHSVTDELPDSASGAPAMPATGRAPESLADSLAFPPYAAGTGEDPEGMDQVMEHLRAHYRENVPMKVLADLVRLSLRQFHRNFKKRYGMPPNQFLIRMRVLAARDMLVSDKRPVAKIAYDLGFADDTLFIRQFKARMGMTPLQYRKAYR